jgi:drug/metabolite transporter (DMT)-like permease
MELRVARMPWLVWFLLLAAIWGCSFWWIKLGLEAFTTVEVAFGRLALGAGALLVVSVVTRSPLPRRAATWRHLAVLGLLLNSLPFTLFAFGETRISSVLAGIINAMTPLATLAVILVAFPEERPTAERVLGLAVGFGGVLVVLGVWQGLPSGQLAGVLACLAAVCCYGVAFPYARRHLGSGPDGPVSLATGQVLLGAAFLLPVLLATEVLGTRAVRPSLTVGPLGGMLALGVLGSGIAYVLNFRIITAVGGSTASAVTYLTPAVAVLVGVAFLRESLTWYEPVGAAIVLLGVALAQGRLSPRACSAAVGLVRRRRPSPVPAAAGSGCAPTHPDHVVEQRAP